jgi:hypothetical protein
LFTLCVFLGFFAAIDNVKADSMPLGEVVNKLSLSQHRGGWFRDRSIYSQKIYVERYKDRNSEGEYERRFARRQSIAEVSADEKGEVIARLISDTNNKLEPKKVKSSSRTVWGAPAFLELIFFPMYPEKVKHYQITDLGTTRLNDQEMRILRIFPKERQKVPLLEGVFYLNPETGHPLRLQVNRLHNFQELDKKLKDLLEFEYDLTYQTLPNGVTVPSMAVGKGNSRITRHKGFFQFSFEEWGFQPNPRYPEVNEWYEKMRDFNEPERDTTPPDLMKNTEKKTDG